MWLCGWILAAETMKSTSRRVFSTVLDDVAVGLHIKGVEELAPPLFGEVRLEVRNRTEARTRCQASWALRLGRHYHGGRLSSSLPPAAAGGEHRPLPSAPTLGRSTTRPLWPQQNAILSLSNFPVKLLSVDDAGFVQAVERRDAAIATLMFASPSTAMKKPSVPWRAGVRSSVVVAAVGRDAAARRRRPPRHASRQGNVAKLRMVREEGRRSGRRSPPAAPSR